MAREPIPEELQRFVLTSVPSVPFVEALLVYAGAQGQAIPLETVAARIYLSDKATAEIVEQLVAARLVARSTEGQGHRLEAATPELAAMIALLARFYRTHLMEITGLIHSRTLRRAQQFADAFKLRKEP